MVAIPFKKSLPPRTVSGARSVPPPAVRNRSSLPAPDHPRIEVELNLFTDQPNPRWLLGKVNTEALLAQLPEESSLIPAELSGYCGFTIRIDSGGGKRNIQVFHNTALERWLLDTGRFCMPSDLLNLVEGQLI